MHFYWIVLRHAAPRLLSGGFFTEYDRGIVIAGGDFDQFGLTKTSDLHFYHGNAYRAGMVSVYHAVTQSHMAHFCKYIVHRSVAYSVDDVFILCVGAVLLR